MSPRVPQAYLKARRTEILEAAFRCFMQKGFQKTTMQDIYQATGLSPGAVYNYFSGKSEIIIAAISEAREWTVSSIDSRVSAGSGDSLTNLVHYWISLLQQEEYIRDFAVRLDYYAASANDPDVRAAVLKTQDVIHAKLVELVRQKQKEGVFNPELDPLSIVRVIMSVLFGMSIHRLLEPGLDLEVYGQVFEALINGRFSRPVTGPQSAEPA